MRFLVAAAVFATMVMGCSPRPDARAKPTPVYIKIAQDGSITVNGKPTTYEAFQRDPVGEMRRAVASSKQQAGGTERAQ